MCHEPDPPHLSKGRFQLHLHTHMILQATHTECRLTSNIITIDYCRCAYIAVWFGTLGLLLISELICIPENVVTCVLVGGLP